MKKTKRNWWDAPITIMGNCYSGSKFPEKLEEQVKFKKKLGFDVEHWLGCREQTEGEEGGDSGKGYRFKTEVGFRKDELTDYLKVAHKLKLRVIVYLNVHWFSSAFGGQYFMRDSKGNPATAYGSGYLACPAGPFLDWSLQVAEDLGRYNLDGVFLDGPVCTLCYCENCRRKFKERYGIELPEDTNILSAKEKRWLRKFPIDNLVNYLKCFKETFNKNNPGGLVYHNGESFGEPGFANQAAAQIVDMLGVEGGFVGYGPLKSQFFLKTSATAKLCEAQADGKPTVIFIDFGFKGFDYYSHPEAEIYRMYASSIAHNANPWFLLFPEEPFTGGIKTGVRMNHFLQDNRQILTETKSLARVALLYSGLNLQLNQEQEPEKQDDVHAAMSPGAQKMTGSHGQCFQGMYNILTKSQIPFDIVTEETMEKRLDKYELLILPDVMAMNSRTVKQIKTFIKQGGNLLATFDTSLFDEDGRPRKDYGLGDLFGCSAGNLEKPTNLDYLWTGNENFMTRELTQKRMPCPARCRYVEFDKNRTAPLFFYYARMPRRYTVLPNVSDRPAGLLRKYGKGEVVFIPAGIGAHYLEYSFPEHRQIVANAVRHLSHLPVFLSGYTHFIEVSLRQNQRGQKLLHLINLTGTERPAENILSLPDIGIALKIDRKIKTVRAILTGKNLKYKQKRGWIQFTLPLLEHYELIVVD